ncbi:MAG TPA: PAS domain-containing protein, partial [Azonexus sp.]|nr:PAS domain-containing protein [Azonexus sp.]
VVVDAEQRMVGMLSQHHMLERLGIVLIEQSRDQLENRLGLVLEATGVGTWEYDHRREILIRSTGLNKLFKFSADPVYEKLDDFLLRVDFEDQDRVALAFRELLASSPETFSIDYQVVGGDGAKCWVSSRGRVFERDSEGRPLRSVGVTIDIQQQKTAALQLRQSEARFRNLMENLPLPVGYLNARNEVVFINHHFTEVFGYVLHDIPDLDTWAACAYPDESYRTWAFETWEESLRLAADADGVIRPVDYRVCCKDGSIRVAEISGVTLGEGLLTTFTDVTERRQQQALLEFGNAILQHISIGAPLADVLDFIAREIEDQDLDIRCSVLLLDVKGTHLRHGAAPSLPREFCAAIDGVEIGPSVGSCGTAAYLGEAVFVADIASNPLWADYADLALRNGLAACWSSPILSSLGKVLGTFAVYWTKPCPELSPIIRRYVETATALASIALEGVQREAELHGMIDELRRWQQLTLGREGRVLELKREVNALLVHLGEAPRYGSVAGGGVAGAGADDGESA